MTLTDGTPENTTQATKQAIEEMLTDRTWGKIAFARNRADEEVFICMDESIKVEVIE